MAKRKSHRIWTGQTDLSKIGRQKGKRKRNPNDYKPPAAQAQRKADGRYVSFQMRDGGPKLNKATKELYIKPACGTILNGKVIFKHGERPNGDKYKFPIVAGDRCNKPAVVSKRGPVQNHHRYAEHIGIRYVDENGESHKDES